MSRDMKFDNVDACIINASGEAADKTIAGADSSGLGITVLSPRIFTQAVDTEPVLDTTDGLIIGDVVAGTTKWWKATDVTDGAPVYTEYATETAYYAGNTNKFKAKVFRVKDYSQATVFHYIDANASCDSDIEFTYYVSPDGIYWFPAAPSVDIDSTGGGEIWTSDSVKVLDLDGMDYIKLGSIVNMNDTIAFSVNVNSAIRVY